MLPRPGSMAAVLQRAQINTFARSYKEKAIQGAREKDIFNRLTGCGLCKTTVERA